LYAPFSETEIPKKKETKSDTETTYIPCTRGTERERQKRREREKKKKEVERAREREREGERERKRESGRKR